MTERVDLQLVFPRHNDGVTAGEESRKKPPPVGLLSIATFIRKRCPGTIVEVLDGNYTSEEWLISRIIAPVVGFSVWFTNYETALAIAHQVKSRNPSTLIVFGGPHATALSQRILNNNSFIDAVVVGDGEEAMLGLLNGSIEPKGLISQPVQMDKIPPFDLETLVTPYKWNIHGPLVQAFPISCIRGCFRKVRCEYCSLPTTSLRTTPVDRAWQQIRMLYERYGIDFFFETGDTFLPSYARELVKCSERQSVRWRIYSYPGILKPEVAALYAELGVTDIFLGIESVLIWQGGFKRAYEKSYSIQSLLEEIELAGTYGIEVMPSFIFGLPGETSKSLEENKELVREVLCLPNVRDFHLNPPIPLPGTQYFNSCIKHSAIALNYRHLTGSNLASSDVIDYLTLSKGLIDATTEVGSAAVFTAVDELLAEHPYHVSHWYAEKGSDKRHSRSSGRKRKLAKSNHRTLKNRIENII